ncbi:MAG: fibronectin type III domain-containing protein, partial [Pseudomonadota bacterium]
MAMKTSRRGPRPVSGARSALAALAAVCAAALIGGAEAAAGPRAVEKPLSLDAALSSDGRRIELRWPKGDAQAETEVLFRRLGERGIASWREVRPRRLTPTRALVEGLEPGVAYEFQVARDGAKATRLGYWTAGVRAPADESPGVALLVVDRTVAPAIEARLARLEADLAGEGWRVRRALVDRGDAKTPVETLAAAREIRDWIRARRAETPEAAHSILLIGHVPLPISGRSAPDGHKPRPHPTDLFYADADGEWRDDGAGRLLHDRVPSDHIEMRIGRIDFSGLAPRFGEEAALLNGYLDKNHAWRRGALGPVDGAYGQAKHLRVEIDGLANLVGPRAVAKGGHHKVGRTRSWLFGVDFGSWKIEPYLEGEFGAVFAVNFGSHKQDYSRKNNAMAAMLARPRNTVAVGWGGR